MQSIGEYAFQGCSSLTSITIPSSVTSIGSYAFSGCTSLTSITIPSGVTNIGDSAFYGCDSLQYNTEDDLNYLGNERDLYLVLMGVQDTTKTTYSIKETTRFINSDAFHYCNNLTSIIIPSGVTSICGSTFSDCSSLQSVMFDGDSQLQSIGDRAFSGCSSLTSIIIPSSVTSIGEYAFYGCSSLTIYCEAVKKPSRWHTNWNNSNRPVVWDCLNNDVADDGYIHVVVEDIRYALKDNVAMVARNACSGDIVIPASVEYKGKQYPVTSIGSSAFSECSSLTSITIPSSVTSIDYSAFEDCNSLTTITIPSGVTIIDTWTFYGCDNLQDVYYGGNEEQWTQIQIGYNNYSLKDADRYYYSADKPSSDVGNYWRWVDGKPTVWKEEDI